MMATTKHSRNDTMKSLVDGAKRKKEDFANIFLMVFMMILVLGNFYFALTYTPNSGCDPGEGSVNVAVFCLVAGFTSLPLAISGYVMWKKGRSTNSVRESE